MRLHTRTAGTTLLALIVVIVIVIALVIGVYFGIRLNTINTTTATTTSTSKNYLATTSTAPTIIGTDSSTVPEYSNSVTVDHTTQIITSSTPVTFISSSVPSSSTTSPGSTTSVTYTTESMTGTGTSIPGWEFLVRIVLTGSDATINSTLTYIGSQNGTVEIGYPVALTEVKDVNGDVIWSTPSTALLRIVNVTFGQPFISTVNISGVLQEGKPYAFDAWPQLHSQNGEFIGNQLELTFDITIPSATGTDCTYTFTQEPTTYMTVSDQTVTLSSYTQTITTTC